MLNRSKTFMGVAFAALCINTAQAVTAVPVVTTNQTLSFAENTSDFGQTFSKDYKGYNFLSNFLFSVGGSSDFDSGLISVSGKTTDLSFTGFDLYTSTGNLVKAGANELAGKMDVWSLSVENLVTGSYRLTVAGSVLGASGGSFGGNINVSPVPEPATWGMMIGGLAIVGIAVRRRKDTARPHFTNALAA